LNNSAWLFSSPKTKDPLPKSDDGPSFPVYPNHLPAVISSPCLPSSTLTPAIPLVPSPSLLFNPACLLPQAIPSRTNKQSSEDSKREPPRLPGFREAEAGNSSLLAALESLFPSLTAPFDSFPLPTALGRDAFDPKVDLGSYSSCALVKGGKAFACSRGIGSELSPVKTWSSRKKQVDLSLQNIDCVPTSPNSMALRAMKALTRDK
jgi:hypothetical protein